MTCHVCSNPTCLDDCSNYPPPALKVGSAEHKLQELLKIANEIASIHMEDHEYNAPTCIHCDAEHDYKSHITPHYESCPILKLERFKAEL